MKTLISWIAYNNDFVHGQVNETGPTVQLYKHHWAYDRHVLLSNEDIRLAHLETYLKAHFPKKKVESRLVSVSDVINLRELRNLSEQILMDYAGDEIEIFTSPGTPIMQLAWFLCHHSLGLNTRIFQTRPAEKSKNNIPEKIYLELEQSDIPTSFVIRETGSDKRPDSNYLITDSMRPIYDLAYKIAQTDRVTTFIKGETGTGKEHLARYIHENSNRKNKPYLTVNCSAFSDQLLESRLFGYKKGAFTGAEYDTVGILEIADKGTVFLDEIGDISPYMQQSLLRFLQNGEINPIGGKPIKVDVRVICATHRNLPLMCKEEKFRWDLYHRLNVADLTLPTLLDRGQSEIKELADFFLKTKAKQFRKPRIKLLERALNVIVNYGLPGNVRELENLIERCYVFCSGKIDVPDLPEHIRNANSVVSLLLVDAEKSHIQRVLKIKDGNIKQAADALGIVRNTLKKKMAEYKL